MAFLGYLLMSSARTPLAPKFVKTYEFAHVAASVPSGQSFSGSDDIGTSWVSCHSPVPAPDPGLQAPGQALIVLQVRGGL